MRISDWSSDVCSSDLIDPDQRAALAPDAVDQRVARRGAAIDPGDARVAQQVVIRLLEQHAGGEARIILVEGGLEREAARRAKEMDEHRKRPPIEVERAQVELSGRGRGGHDGAEPGFGLAMARERRSSLPFPAARLAVETGVVDRKSTRLNSSN